MTAQEKIAQFVKSCSLWLIIVASSLYRVMGRSAILELLRSCTFWALLLFYAFAVALLIYGLGKLDTPLKQVAIVVALAPAVWLPVFLAGRWFNKIDPSLTRPEEENLALIVEPLWQKFLRVLSRSDAKLCPRRDPR